MSTIKMMIWMPHSAQETKESKTVKESAVPYTLYTPWPQIDNSGLSCWCVHGKGA